jgi:hypothetical protein
LTLVGIVAAVAAIASGGGGSGSGPKEASGVSTGGSTAAAQKRPKPKPLSRSELIAKADEICEASQSTYGNVLSAELEEVPDVAYATTLVGISSRGVERFRRLKPKAPASVEPAFRKYVHAQERVMRYDRQALDAAEAEDAGAYVAARERRDAEQGERYDLAREVGLRRCSLQPG